ncbi:hypothetical protein RJ640_001121, partial [Escallonia rubra]
MTDTGVVEDNFDGSDVLSVPRMEGGFLIHVPTGIDLSIIAHLMVAKFLWETMSTVQIRLGCMMVLKTLTNVRHVPKLMKILISLGALDSNGCSYRAAGGVLRIMKGALIMMKGTIAGATATTSSFDIDSDTTKLWHMRLGHMIERGMDMLCKQGLLGSKKIGKLDFCEHCVFEKQCRVKFSQAVHTTTGT